MSLKKKLFGISVSPIRAGMMQNMFTMWIRSMSTKITQDNRSRTVNVTFHGQEHESRYPYVWLRDNCQCPQCYHPTSQQRLFLLKNLDTNVEPKEIKINENQDIVIEWPDKHTSTFSQSWLNSRAFEEHNRQKLANIYDRKSKLWGSELQNNIPKTKFSELITNDNELYKWIVNLEEIGMSLITEAPTDTGILSQIGERVAFLTKTNYGENFTVKSKESPSNIAYSSSELGLHTDLPYYHYTPGIQMLHCISQAPTSGGENQFTDGFYVAQLMKENFPDLYQVLVNTAVDFMDIGTDAYTFHKIAVAPVIGENREGTVTKITYNNQCRGNQTGLTLEEVHMFYKALMQFEKLLNDDKCRIRYKLNNGEIACFHNYRVLHGRQSYTVVGKGERHLQGGYINWDELKSRRRVLQNKLGVS